MHQSSHCKHAVDSGRDPLQVTIGDETFRYDKGEGYKDDEDAVRCERDKEVW
jgi:hypothetical protein